MLRFMVCLLVVTSPRTQAQSSAQYLQNAIRDLRYTNTRQTIRRVDATPTFTTIPPLPEPPAERRIQYTANVPPPLSLTKGELTAIYEAALAKGETVQMPDGSDGYIHAAVHELDQQPEASEHEETSGYYYYYYPIKSFIDHDKKPPPAKPPTTTHPPYQVHSHTHQHNIKITPVEEKDKKSMEPLFMAISGFIGMAVMFVLSILVFPAFGIKKPKIPTKKNDRLNDIARIALEAIEGKVCAERFACELGKTARAFNLGENRFVKLFRRLAPASFNRHFDRVGKYTNKKLKCTAIPCKKKNIPPKKKPQQNKKS